MFDERVRGGHRQRPLLGVREEQRHYVSAIIGVAGLAMAGYGMASAPGYGHLTREERAKIQLGEQRQEDAFQFQQLMLPWTLEAMGLEAEMDADGKVRRIKKIAKTDEDLRSEEIRRLSEERVLKALKGEGDIDPAATRSFNEDEKHRDEYLARTLGPDAKLSTAGQTAVARSKESRHIAENAIRRGELQTNEAIALGRKDRDDRTRMLNLGLMRGMPADRMGLTNSMNYFPHSQPYDDLRYQAAMAQAKGYADLGGGLMKGAAGLYGAYKGSQGPGSPGVVRGQQSLDPSIDYWSQ